MAHLGETDDTARSFATRFLDGSFAETAELFTEEGRESVVKSFPAMFQEKDELGPSGILEAYWRGLFSQYGAAKNIGDVSVDSHEVTVELQFESGSATAIIGVDGSAVTNFSFSPEYEVPNYVDREALNERGLQIDTGEIVLDGVLTVPEGEGPFPAVILVHGAGIHDPDGTAGNSKIFKDVAWGLATEGVVTLRYEKRLAEHEVADEHYTLDTVVVDDAVAATAELTTVDEVDDDAVFVAGHSQGGMCAPRIAERHGDAAGVIVLDARTDSTLDPDDLAFMRYEIEPDGDLTREQQEEFERERETVRRLANGDYENDETLWGRPGTWHRSVRTYNPAGTASSLDAPVFVAKSGRADEKIQPELATWLKQEFEKWQAIDLADGSRVEFYENLDHHLQQGFAPYDPLALYFGGNVAEPVILDLTEWIRNRVTKASSRHRT